MCHSEGGGDRGGGVSPSLRQYRNLCDTNTYASHTYVHARDSYADVDRRRTCGVTHMRSQLHTTRLTYRHTRGRVHTPIRTEVDTKVHKTYPNGTVHPDTPVCGPPHVPTHETTYAHTGTPLYKKVHTNTHKVHSCTNIHSKNIHMETHTRIHPRVYTYSGPQFEALFSTYNQGVDETTTRKGWGMGGRKIIVLTRNLFRECPLHRR